MTLRRREEREWVDYVVDGKVVKSPCALASPSDPLCRGVHNSQLTHINSCLLLRRMLIGWDLRDLP